MIDTRSNIKPARWGQAGFSARRNLWRGLKAAFPFWEGAGNIFDIANRIASTTDGAPVWTHSPHGIAAEFDGSDDAFDLGTPPALNITSDKLTIAVGIVKPAQANPDGNDGRVISASDGGTGDRWSLQIRSTDQAFTSRINGISLTGSALTEGLHHLALQYDGAKRQNWIDGKVDATANTTGNLAAHSGIRIGRHGTSDTNRSFAGKVLYVYIWERALADIEIQQIASDPYGLIRPSWHDFPALFVQAAGGGTTTKRYSLALVGIG